MLKVIMCGRLTADVDLRYSTKDTSVAVARYTMAIDVGYGDNKRTEFLRCIAFGKAGEFASKYFHKGQRVLVEGTIKQGEYTNKEGQKVKTIDIILESQELAEGYKENQKAPSVEDGFSDIEGATNEDIPF